MLEWTRLSDVTGDPRYGQLAQRAEQYLLNPQPQPFAEPWPGLVGSDISIANGQFTDNSGGWNGGDDSFYEYLIKMFVYDAGRFGAYKDRWVKAADSSIAHLASHPAPRPDLTFLAAFQGQQIQKSSGHLACFDGGNFILGGLVLKQQKYIDFGIELVESCEVCCFTFESQTTAIADSIIPAGHLQLYPHQNRPRRLRLGQLRRALRPGSLLPARWFLHHQRRLLPAPGGARILLLRLPRHG